MSRRMSGVTQEEGSRGRLPFVYLWGEVESFAAPRSSSGLNWGGEKDERVMSAPLQEVRVTRGADTV